MLGPGAVGGAGGCGSGPADMEVALCLRSDGGVVGGLAAVGFSPQACAVASSRCLDRAPVEAGRGVLQRGQRRPVGAQANFHPLG